MISIDILRASFPNRGFAVYAYEPGGPVQVEMIWPDGSRMDATGATEEEAILSLVPELALQWFAAAAAPEDEPQTPEREADPHDVQNADLFG